MAENTKKSIIGHQLAELTGLISALTSRGIKITLTVTDGVLYADLNTEGKSGCTLIAQSDEPGYITARTRYEEITIAPTVLAVIDTVYHKCVRGRGYFSQEWLNVFKDEGYDCPLGNY